MAQPFESRSDVTENACEPVLVITASQERQVFFIGSGMRVCWVLPFPGTLPVRSIGGWFEPARIYCFFDCRAIAAHE